jgi:hypothetical protein
MKALKLVLLSCVLIAATASGESSYNAKNWRQAINILPCDAFKKNADGSWTTTRTIILGDGSIRWKGINVSNQLHAFEPDETDKMISDLTMKNTAETRILARRCP